MTTAPGAAGDEYANDAVDVAYQAIRRAIIDGAYPAGSRLSEEELSERSVGFRIDDEDLEDLKTVRDAVDYVVGRL